MADLAPQGTASTLYTGATSGPGSLDPSLAPQTAPTTTQSFPQIAPTSTSDSFSQPATSSIAGAQGPSAPSTTPPTDNLAPGSSGQDVSKLQDYLVQMGYLTPDQLTGGQGTYGPKTTAAVAKLQTDLGVSAGKAAGSYGPQTQAALASKYQNLFSSVKTTQAPDQAGAASQQLQATSQESTDPVFGAMASSLGPIMQSLSQVLQNINNPALTAVSLQSEYNDLAQQNNLPEMNAKLMNMTNIMNGTEDDVRQEITASGGTVTESQVLGITAARNKTVLKQYNALATQYQAAQTNVSNMMQYATQDQATQLQRQQATASVTESMASIESQMLTMGNTMQKNAQDNLNKVVTNVGYQGLAAQAQGNPAVLSSYESLLGLAPGSLSDPTALSQLETYRQQTIAQGAQKIEISGFNSGFTPGGTASGASSGGGNNGSISAQIPSSSLVRPSFVAQATPLSMSSNQMQQFLVAAPEGKTVIGGSAGVNASGNNVTVNGVGNYVVQPDGSYYLSSAIPQTTQDTGSLISSLKDSNPPTLTYGDISSIMAQSPGSVYPPASTAFYREQRSARQLVGNYVNSPVYETVSNAPLPFARIQAAQNGDNSVSDIELVDSYITLAKGQGQITEAQVSAINSASSVSDKLNIIKQKIVGAGALISSDQRQSLLNLSGNVFNQYATTYQQMYTQAIKTLAKNHIEPAIWGVVPDFSQLIGGSKLDTSQ